ncbi:phosphoribosyltransferase [Rhizobium sp. NRK18]|uniref:phosphoribosyltransferase n=1 Tax=Rhizobium sp. NRK18 TaxID=2964667 RepID=UPI0021C2D5AB|nr:phosphoribosyltransferase [Rhizobium sp. NRK18]MCQ2002746.1 phosphoribosyltransferase [Rhizobium sp. NRK18]
MTPTDFWQDIFAPCTYQAGRAEDCYVAELDDGRQIKLPVRPLPDGRNALASLIITQASFAVQDALAERLAALLRPYGPDVVVGLPTLGLTLAAAVARVLGHDRYVALGTSRKFWYDEALSVPLSSITTPDQSKRLYIDPRMLPLIGDRRVVLIDDVISSGTSMVAGLALMRRCGVEPVALGCAMLQTDRWRERLAGSPTEWNGPVVGVFSTPIIDLAIE